MKFFFDTEFIERGAHQPIDLISIGIVTEYGHEYYAVSSEFNKEDANEWVRENVLPHVGDAEPKTLAEIAQEIIAFVGSAKPEFWAYYCSYDWVVLCQIFGTMMDLPKSFPMFCNDLKVEAERYGNPKLLEQTSTEHNALEDARWTRDAYLWLKAVASGFEAIIVRTKTGSKTVAVGKASAAECAAALEVLRSSKTRRAGPRYICIDQP